jgi:hypothetical protein
LGSEVKKRTLRLDQNRFSEGERKTNSKTSPRKPLSSSNAGEPKGGEKTPPLLSFETSPRL